MLHCIDCDFYLVVVWLSCGEGLEGQAGVDDQLHQGMPGVGAAEPDNLVADGGYYRYQDNSGGDAYGQRGPTDEGEDGDHGVGAW